MLIKGAENASGRFSSSWEQLFLGEHQSHFLFTSLLCIFLPWNWWRVGPVSFSGAAAAAHAECVSRAGHRARGLCPLTLPLKAGFVVLSAGGRPPRPWVAVPWWEGGELDLWRVQLALNAHPPGAVAGLQRWLPALPWHCLVLPAPLAAIKQQMHLLGQITHCRIQARVPVPLGAGTAAATLRLGKSLREAAGGGWAAGLDPAQAPARCPSPHQSHHGRSVLSCSSSSSWPSTPKQSQHPKSTSAATNSPKVGWVW